MERPLGQNCTEIMSNEKPNSVAMFLRIRTDIYQARTQLKKLFIFVMTDNALSSKSSPLNMKI